MREELACPAALGVDSGGGATEKAPAGGAGAAPALDVRAADDGPLSAALAERLQLQDTQQQHQQQQTTITTAAAKHVQAAFADLLSLSPTALFTPLLAHAASSPSSAPDAAPAGLQHEDAAALREREARYWDVFADVYEQELRARSALQAGGGQQLRDQHHHDVAQHDARQQQQHAQQPQLSKEAKRQILADILVWAEITQAHYDTHTASFVTAPHDGDASFQRIGQLFKAAKKQRGLA